MAFLSASSASLASVDAPNTACITSAGTGLNCKDSVRSESSRYWSGVIFAPGIRAPDMLAGLEGGWRTHNEVDVFDAPITDAPHRLYAFALEGLTLTWWIPAPRAGLLPARPSSAGRFVRCFRLFHHRM